MARTDGNAVNGWVPEDTTGEVIKKIQATSAVEAVARRVPMTRPQQRVPRFAADGVDVVPEGTLIPQKEADLDTVLLEAVKYANRFTVSVEDDRDAVVNMIDQYKLAWADSYARQLDTGCLGVTVAGDGSTASPYNSVYFEVSEASDAAERHIQTAGAVEFEHLNDAFTLLETGDYNGDLVVVAHPAFKGALRNLKDSAGDRVVSEPLGGVPTLFGYTLAYSTGAVATDDATDRSGNPLLIVGNRQHLLLGVLDGPESAVADFRWEYDEREVKMRSRRAFAVATAEAFVVVEKTASGG